MTSKLAQLLQNQGPAYFSVPKNYILRKKGGHSERNSR